MLQVESLEMNGAPSRERRMSYFADRGRAAQGPVIEAVSAAGEAAPQRAPNVAADGMAEALGRRTLSTAFVRIGPDRHLTVDLRDGRTIVLRDVAMRAKDYCGTLAGGVGRPFCGGYAEVVAARPGGAPMTGDPGATAVDAAGVAVKPTNIH